MNLTQQSIIFFGTILMVGALVVSFIPILPGTVIVWPAAMAFGIVSQWTHFTPAAGIITSHRA